MMLLNIDIHYVINLTTALFFIGLMGVALNRKNILISLMSIEIILLAVNINFVAFSIYLDDIIGQIFVIFILAVAASEAAIGLSIITALYKLKSSIDLSPVKKKSNNKL